MIDLDEKVKLVFESLRCKFCGCANYQPNTRCRNHSTKELFMSFSVSFVGKPEAIKLKLVEESERLTSQSKEEFDAVKPALEIILDQQVGDNVVSLNAYGHASFSNGIKTFGACSVDIKQLGKLV